MVALLNCPQEILRNVLGNLDLPELKNVRLTCRTLGEIGAETLLPAVHVIFTKKSIDRLRDVSLHPIISLHVKEIIYEADRLDYYDGQDEWEQHVIDTTFLESLPLESIEELQSMSPDDPTRIYNDYSQTKLDTGWKKYKALVKEQTEICRREIDKRELGRAIMRMPRLEGITVEIGQALTPGHVSAYFARSFRELLIQVSGENSLKDGEPPGYRHLLPLLMPFTTSEKYNIKALQERGIPIAETLNQEYRVSALKRLLIGGISWLSLRQLEPLMPVLPVALAQVKTLTLTFNTGEMGTTQIGTELEDCADYLRESDALHKFLSACPSLTSLNLGFGSISPEAQAASLDHIVGKTTWKRLSQIVFSRFQLPAEQFCLFLKRHRETLRGLVLEDMCVGRLPETWSSLLSDVRALNIPWKHFRVVEYLHQDGVPDLSLFVDSHSSGPGPDAAQMIEDYVMKKTDFDPLETAAFDEQTGETIWHAEVEMTEA